MSGRARIVAAVPLPVPVHDFARRARQVAAEHGQDVRVASEGEHLVFRTPGTVCGCVSCDEADRARLAELTGDDRVLFRSRMIVCPDCGSDRCPRAAHHDNECARCDLPGASRSRSLPHIHPA